MDQILTEEVLNKEFDELLDGFAVDHYVYQTFNRFLNSHKALISANAELSFKNQKYKELCKQVIAFVEPQVDQSGYGAFPGGDPNLFTPDSDNSEQEINNWKIACEKWNTGNHEGEEGSHRWLTDSEGNVRGTATVATLGYGLYLYEDEEAKALVDEIKALEELK